MTTKHMVIPVV